MGAFWTIWSGLLADSGIEVESIKISEEEAKARTHHDEAQVVSLALKRKLMLPKRSISRVGDGDMTSQVVKPTSLRTGLFHTEACTYCSQDKEKPALLLGSRSYKKWARLYSHEEPRQGLQTGWHRLQQPLKYFLPFVSSTSHKDI